LAKHMVVQDSSEVFKHPKAWPMTHYKRFIKLMQPLINCTSMPFEIQLLYGPFELFQ
jgi:hypothetical protein